MKNKKKAQISMEFILLFSLIFASLIVFIYSINKRVIEIDKREENLILRNLVNDIEKEVILAASVKNNYLRRFNLPNRISGSTYNMTLDKDVLIIHLIENDEVKKEYVSILPRPVKGGFIEDINENTTGHCITKNDFDGIRISNNQASISSNESDLTIGETFEIVVSLNCVEDIRSVRFTLKYDPEYIHPIKENNRVVVEPMSLIVKSPNPLFEEFIFDTSYSGEFIAQGNTKKYYEDEINGRYTHSFIGRDCATGSGNVAKLYFRAIKSGHTEITFDNDFFGQELMIVDCGANEFTKEGIPDSKSGVELKIYG